MRDLRERERERENKERPFETETKCWYSIVRMCYKKEREIECVPRRERARVCVCVKE